MSKQTVIAEDFNRNPITVDLDQLKWRPAAYGIVIKDNKILLSKQINGYDLPGGGMDLGETPEQTVIREIKEETGIIAVNPILIDCGTAFIKGYSSENFYQAIALYYICDYVGGELSIDGFDESEKQYGVEPEWVSLKDIDGIEIGAYRDFREAIKKALKV